MTIPTDRQIWESDIATYWLDDGILVSLSKNPKRTIENITANAALVQQICHHQPLPLLIYLSASPVPDRQTRKFAAEKLPEIYRAMAMVSRPGLSKFIMNILFALKAPPIPMKSFTDDVAAKKWLQQFV